MTHSRDHRSSRSIAAAVALTLLMASCGTDDDAPQADAVVVDDTGSAAASDATTTTTAPADGDHADDTTTTSTAADAPAGTDVAFPVSVDYAGINWSIDDASFVAEGDDDDREVTLLVDLIARNDNPFGMRWPIEVLALHRSDGTRLEPDGQVGTGSGDIELAARNATRTTLEFEVDDELDLAELAFTVAESDRIPAVSSFTGGPRGTAPYPLDVDFAGATKPVAVESDGSMVVEAVHGYVGVDGPGRRASTGARLLVLDIDMVTPASNSGEVCVDEERFRLEVDGQLLDPEVFVHQVGTVRGICPRVPPGATEPITLVFDVETDVEEAALLIIAEEDTDRDRIPIGIGALPACCGE
jgi:hypothetical protein